MSDYDARRRIKSEERPKAAKKTTWTFYKCAVCNNEYMINFDPRTVENAITDKGFICRDCRKTTPPKVVAHPPKAVQIRIEDVIKGVAGR